MFWKKRERKTANPLFKIFRLLLSLFIFAILLGGIYSAYKHFSGLDPLKLDLKSAVTQLDNKIPGEALTLISKVKLPKILGEDKTANGKTSQDGGSETKITSQPHFKFLLIADSHSDNTGLNRAIAQARQSHKDIQFIIGLGDYTQVGTVEELEIAKKEFDLSNLRYFLVPGDHDLWDSRDKNQSPFTNFRQIFGPLYQSFETYNFKFLLLYNSDNYSGMDEEQLKWLEGELERSKEGGLKGIFVFVHEPLFHPSSDHMMGRVTKELKDQANQLTYKFSQMGVKKIFAGDAHYFSQYEEPETKLSMVTVGAVTLERNPQSPRFAVVTVFEDGSTFVEDVEIK